MKVPSSGRQGYKLKAVPSAIRKVLATQPRRPLGPQMAAWAMGIAGVGTVPFDEMDDDEIGGLTFALLKMHGVKRKQVAARVLAKINGLREAQ